MNIGIITQARMASTRLYGKVLLQANGQPMLFYHVNRLKWSQTPIYIATTQDVTDDKIVLFANQHGIPCFRGPSEDVLARFYECALHYKLDAIVRVCSDCPLIDGHLIRMGIWQYIKMNDPFLYLSNSIFKELPIGFDYEIFSFKLLQEAYQNAKCPQEREHVTPYIKKNSSSHITIVNSQSPIVLTSLQKSFRLTMDTIEDFNLLKQLIEKHHSADQSYLEIIEVLTQNPLQAKINAHIVQKSI